MTSAPGKRPQGITASFIQKRSSSRASSGSPSSPIFSPAMMRAAIFASGTPVAFEMKGAVRLARGLASIT